MSEGGRDIPVFEVPLAGDGTGTTTTTTGSTGPGRPRPNWRKLVALSSLAGVVVGVVVAVAVTSEADDDEPTPTTLAPDELASAITVPPTLTPVTDPSVAEPPVTISPVTLPPVPSASAPVETIATDLFAIAASVETLPGRTDIDLDPPDAFRLSDGSLAALDAPLPRRSVTDHVVGVDGFEQTVTITNDPATGRYLIELDFGGAVESAVIDLVGGFTYAEAGPDDWVVIPNDEVAANAGVPDMATFARNLQLGPLRSDTRDAWELVQANGIVATPDDSDVLREWIVVLDAAAVPEWARYAFGPGAEAAPLPSDTKIGFAVYVAADGSIRRVTGAADFGATTQRVVHRLEVLDEPPTIALPVVDPPITSLPGPPPAGSDPAG